MVDSRYKENYYAFVLCVLSLFTVDKSLTYFGLRVNENVKRPKLTREDNLKMRELHNRGMTYTAIGKIYGISACAIEHRIRGIVDEVPIC